MSQGMDDKIRQISEMLNSPDAQEGIRTLFNSLGAPRSDAPADTDQLSSYDRETGLPYGADPSSLSSQESDWINRIQNILSQMNNMHDSRLNLLRSVHPFLNATRRERCSTCMNILKVAGIIKAMTNNGGRLL